MRGRYRHIEEGSITRARAATGTLNRERILAAIACKQGEIDLSGGPF